MEALFIVGIFIAMLFAAVFTLYFMFMSFRSHIFRRLDSIGSKQVEIRQRQEYLSGLA